MAIDGRCGDIVRTVELTGADGTTSTLRVRITSMHEGDAPPPAAGSEDDFMSCEESPPPPPPPERRQSTGCEESPPERRQSTGLAQRPVRAEGKPYVCVTLVTAKDIVAGPGETGREVYVAELTLGGGELFQTSASHRGRDGWPVWDERFIWEVCVCGRACVCPPDGVSVRVCAGVCSSHSPATAWE